MPGQEISMLLLISIILSLLIGTLTFTGSFIAFGKLQGLVSTKPVTFTGQQLFNALIAIIIIAASYMVPTYGLSSFYTIIILSGLLGILLVIPIGGADMPVVISLLNSYSGIGSSNDRICFVRAGQQSLEVH